MPRKYLFERLGGVPFERMDKPQFIQGFSDQNNTDKANFFLSAVALINVPFLNISVCWLWFRLSQTWKRSLGEMRVASLKMRLTGEILPDQKNKICYLV